MVLQNVDDILCNETVFKLYFYNGVRYLSCTLVKLCSSSIIIQWINGNVKTILLYSNGKS